MEQHWLLNTFSITPIAVKQSQADVSLSCLHDSISQEPVTTWKLLTLEAFNSNTKVFDNLIVGGRDLSPERLRWKHQKEPVELKGSWQFKYQSIHLLPYMCRK